MSTIIYFYVNEGPLPEDL